MSASQSTRRLATAIRRTARSAAVALRTVHREQIMIWELFWQSSRIPVARDGPLAWAPSLDGPRLTGSHLPIPDDTRERT